MNQIKHPYGYCPTCGEPGVTRERRPNGMDTCSRGHVYPSRDALSHEARAITNFGQTHFQPDTGIKSWPSAGIVVAADRLSVRDQFHASVMREANRLCGEFRRANPGRAPALQYSLNDEMRTITIKVGDGGPL